MHNFTRFAIAFEDSAADDAAMKLALLAFTAFIASAARAETFVIEADNSGHEATVKIPAGAVRELSANFAESMAGAADSPNETMRLSGDVLIDVAGAEQPIQIKADKIVLELIADSPPVRTKSGRAAAATNKLVRSSNVLAGPDGAQLFVGHVVFDLQTDSGLMQITAQRVEHQLKGEGGA